MNSPDKVFRELGQLYDFYREISKFRIRDRSERPEEPHPRPRPLTPASNRKPERE